MTAFADPDLPEILKSIQTRPLFVVHLPVRRTIDVGDASCSRRATLI